MFMNRVYGIDLGSHMVKIYSQKDNEIMKERNMIAVRNGKDILAAGEDAYEMYEKNPVDVDVSSPMVNGMIANIGYQEIVLHNLFNKTGRYLGNRPVIFFAVPMDMTEIEKRAYYSAVQTGRLRKSKILLVERPIVDAFALGIPVIKTKGSMIVNMGAATTEVSVIADSRVIISKIIPIGGDQFNQTIIDTVRRKNNFFIGMRTAGRLKVSLADLRYEQKIAKKIIGIDCFTGLPKEKIVTSATINEAVLETTKRIATEIRIFLERTPPQINKLIQKDGIYLTGGSSRIPDISRVLSEQIGCPILLSHYYDLCTIYGLKEIITHDALHHWAFTPKKRK